MVQSVLFSKYENLNRDQLRPLLLIGDEDEMQLDKYIDKGDIFIASDAGKRVGVALLIENQATCIELKNMAILPEYQGHGVGSAFIDYLLACYSDDYKQMLVGTGDADFQNMAFYMKAGFRFSGIRKAYFVSYEKPIIVNGIDLQDMVLLTRELA